MRGVKSVLGILLLPLLLASLLGLKQAIKNAAGQDLFWIPFGCGFLSFMAVWHWLPKPMWIYVVGHEATHAAWAMAFGGRVKRFKATSKGGHVVVTKSNVLICLAPYFFPLYAILCIATYAVIRVWYRSDVLEPLFFSSLGFALTFHVVMNLEVLKTQQPDWREHGYFFSGVFVLLMNTLIFGTGLGMLGGLKGIQSFWKGIWMELIWILETGQKMMPS